MDEIFDRNTALAHFGGNEKIPVEQAMLFLADCSWLLSQIGAPGRDWQERERVAKLLQLTAFDLGALGV
jgi:hypothetical protein